MGNSTLGIWLGWRTYGDEKYIYSNKTSSNVWVHQHYKDSNSLYQSIDNPTKIIII
jgi:hypothetical protein